MSEERNEAIYEDHVNQKRTLQAIAEKYNLTRQRVHQIVKEQQEKKDGN